MNAGYAWLCVAGCQIGGVGVALEGGNKSNFPDHAQMVKVVLVASGKMCMGLPEVSYRYLPRLYICYHFSHHHPRAIIHIAAILLTVAMQTRYPR